MWGGLKMQKNEKALSKGKIEQKSDKTSSFAAEAGLRLRPLASTCAIGVGLGVTVLTVDFGTPSYEFTINICTYLIL
jgi:hypothetical protein